MPPAVIMQFPVLEPFVVTLRLTVQQAVSVDDVEKRTGFNFFHMLPDDVEDAVEAVATLEDW